MQLRPRRRAPPRLSSPMGISGILPVGGVRRRAGPQVAVERAGAMTRRLQRARVSAPLRGAHSNPTATTRGKEFQRRPGPSEHEFILRVPCESVVCQARMCGRLRVAASWPEHDGGWSVRAWCCPALLISSRPSAGASACSRDARHPRRRRFTIRQRVSLASQRQRRLAGEPADALSDWRNARAGGVGQIPARRLRSPTLTFRLLSARAACRASRNPTSASAPAWRPRPPTRRRSTPGQKGEIVTTLLAFEHVALRRLSLRVRTTHCVDARPRDLQTARRCFVISWTASIAYITIDAACRAR